MKVTITRRLQFCSGHRVHGHENKCANLHGHNYVVYLTAEAPQLDRLGRIIDFSALKERFGNWIDEQWDHAFLFHERDRELVKLFTLEPFNVYKHYICNFNPTAEEMAKCLLYIAPTLLQGTQVTLTKVTLYETENCFAEIHLNG